MIIKYNHENVYKQNIEIFIWYCDNVIKNKVKKINLRLKNIQVEKKRKKKGTAPLMFISPSSFSF
jgi:hypothetical protein